jgi:hypothetical protein
MTKRLMMAVSLLGVMLSASGASAACAWVLWGLKFSSTGQEQYHIAGVDGYTSLGSCQDAANRKFKQDKQATYDYMCLPDTIDPRGRGGK